DASGNVYTTGYFSGIVDFDPGAGTNNLTSQGNYDVFIQKLDPSGNFLWAKSFGGTSNDYGFSITLDASGNVYTTGYFSGIVDFDAGAGTNNLTSQGSNDVFIQKLDPSGNFLWAKTFGGNSDDAGVSITVDASGNVYTTGYFLGTADFDPGAGTNNLTPQGSADVFIQKLDPSGNFLWAKTFGGTFGDVGISITVDASGNVYTTGYFSGIVDFDPGAGTNNLTAQGFDAVFIQKMSQCSPTTGTDVQTACDTYTWIDGNTYTFSNNTATHILTNVAGCDSVVTLNLTINSVSDLNTSLNGLTITSDNTNAAYQWLDCDNGFAPISGETNQDFTATVNGNYAVELTENGCVDTSSCVAITTVGIIENTFNEDFTLYPNPTDGLFSIQFNSSQENITLRILDATGKLLDTKVYEQVDLIEYELNKPGGFYLIEVSNGENQLSLIRLIKN
ncbi:MAG: SBBP repeat-containing protein, partial [Bacteroidota bacterium]|nr:SBBP repeat-containing protein [Bacteroidota bacterium]